jgi:hypothetical protein
MREIESDGFITREEDLMKNERKAKPMTECGYPRCEECDKCVDGYCTVPMVISKQIYLNTAERIMLLEENVSALENLVYDEILGDGEDFIPDEEEGVLTVLTEEEYNELSPMQKYWYDKSIEEGLKSLCVKLRPSDGEDSEPIKIRKFAPRGDNYTPLNEVRDEEGK